MIPTWQDGLVLESDDGDYRIQMGTFVRFDGRFAEGDAIQQLVPNTFMMRTLRATFQGKIAKVFTFRVQPDFGGSGQTVADAWFDIAFSDAFHIRFGRDKVPVGMEGLLQDSNVVFLERSLAVNLLPGRDTGVQVYGNLANGVVSYAAGFFNGQVDGAANSSNGVDADSAKDSTGRILVRPFSEAKGLKKLSVGVGATTGRQENAGLPVFRTSIQQTYFSFAKDAFSNGPRSRVAPQASYYAGVFGAYAEWVKTRQRVTRATTTADIENTAWHVVGSLIVTGEPAGERIRPKHAFDPEHHRWGAIQLTARCGELMVDSAAFALRLTDDGSSRHAQVVTAGTNWYLTTNVKMQFNVERTAFDHNTRGARPTEHAALIRMQLNY